ncbi:MAG: transposase [Rhodococcus sp. (in: high G+C Gram-positive bacteria)]|uniref:transposase n=1 Tax=Rhodococcus sp. TaxID=1831 RepID=UPI003BAFE336
MIAPRVRGGRDPQPSAAIIDSQSVQGPDTVPGSSRGCDAVKKTNGRKRHIAVDSSGLLLAGVVTMAGTGMARADSWLRCALTSQRSVWWADGGYAGRLIEWAKNVLSLTVQVVKRTDDAKGIKVLPRRWWSRERSRGSANTGAASAPTKRGPTIMKRWSTSP